MTLSQVSFKGITSYQSKVVATNRVAIKPSSFLLHRSDNNLNMSIATFIHVTFAFLKLISIYSNKVLNFDISLQLDFSKQSSCESEGQSLAKFAAKVIFISKYCLMAFISLIVDIMALFTYRFHVCVSLACRANRH